MFSQERQRLILTILADEGRARVQALAAQLNVSDDTVRRDLHALAEQGVLHNSRRGGSPGCAAHGPGHPARRILPEAKTRIGRGRSPAAIERRTRH